MSNVWKKFTKNFQPSKTNLVIENSNEEQNSGSFSKLHQKPLSITPDDEAILSDLDKQPYDPLSISSQIAQNLIEALSQKSVSTSSYSFFREYLESKEADFLLLFLEEIENYQKNFTITKINENEPDENLKGTNTTPSILPDLVSNIPKNVVVTPHDSPQEEFVEFNTRIQVDPNILISESGAPPSDSTHLATTSSNDLSYNASNMQDIPCSLKVALYIFKKYIDDKAEYSADIGNSVRSLIEEKLFSKQITAELFSQAKEEVLFKLEKQYLKYVESQYFLKHEIEVLTGENVLLQDVLRSESALPYFMEYLEQESSQIYLEFWISVSNFRNHLLSNNYKNAEQSQSDAMILYDKYFSLQARTPIGFSNEVRLKVESSICQEEGPLYDCFDIPLRIILHVLNRDYLRAYLSSSLHMNLLRELVNKVKVNRRISRIGSASLSNEGSEQSCPTTLSASATKISINEKNTLLAMDSSHGLELLKNLADPSLSMRIDSKQILDPDSLWRRKNFRTLSCGYVDQYGRFESDIQPEPGRKESRFSRTLKKLLNKEETKAKEDLAYKVAEMVIKDVSKLCGTNLSHSATSPDLQPVAVQSSPSSTTLQDKK